MSIQAVIFDIYNTLLDVGPPPPDADERWRRLCRNELGAERPLSRLEFSIACNKVIAQLHEAARRRGIAWPEVDWPAVVGEVIPQVSQLSPQQQAEFHLAQIQTGHTTRMRAETAGMLRWLKERGLVLGIASNAQAYTRLELDAALQGHGLSMNLFDPGLCFWSFEHGFSKPDPHVFQILTVRLGSRGIGPAATLMVGDRLDNDIEPARAHGWSVWQLAPQTGSDWAALRERLSNPKHPKVL